MILFLKKKVFFKVLDKRYLTCFKQNNFFLRKNKFYVKGRYSRNRQFIKSIVYWTLYFNIFTLIGLYYLCYSYVFILSYFWLLSFYTINIFIYFNLFKLNLLSIKNILIEFRLFFNYYLGE